MSDEIFILGVVVSAIVFAAIVIVAFGETAPERHEQCAAANLNEYAACLRETSRTVSECQAVVYELKCKGEK